MRTINELYNLKGKVYVRFENTQAYHHFVQTAMNEEFKMPRGEDDILVLNSDRSFSHTGFVGHMAFHNASSVSGQKLLRVDYSKWISGADDYLYHGAGK